MSGFSFLIFGLGVLSSCLALPQKDTGLYNPYRYNQGPLRLTSPYSIQEEPQQIQPYYVNQNGQPIQLRAVKKIRITQPPPLAHEKYAQPTQSPAIYRSPAIHPQTKPLVEQPTYYIQRSPPPQQQRLLPRPAPTAVNTVQEEEEQEDYPSDPNPQYNFSFDVKDDELTNYQNRQEEREGGVIKGSYSVVDPDGYIRTVIYTADAKNGFQAKVVREPTDVKVKFPVPTTESPVKTPVKLASAPVFRTQAHQPQYYYPQQYSNQQYNPQNVYSAQSAIQPTYINHQIHQQQQRPHEEDTQEQPTYVLRRVPSVGAGARKNTRIVKVLRATK